jgi:hypothetical protein
MCAAAPPAGPLPGRPVVFQGLGVQAAQREFAGPARCCGPKCHPHMMNTSEWGDCSLVHTRVSNNAGDVAPLRIG